MAKLTYLLLPVVIFFLFGFFLFRYLTAPLQPNSSLTQEIVIAPRSSVDQVARLLTDRHLIRSPLAFKLYLRLTHLDSQLQAGRFRLSPRQSLPEIVRTLTQAGQLDIWVTIPEGFRREQIAELFQKKLSLSYSDFVHLTQDKEGKLFPDTYLIPTSASPQTVINILLQNYQRQVQPFRSQLDSHHLGEQGVLTLASIVERETLSVQEKPIVAGILLKRLEHQWPLQVDATIQYILGKPGQWWPVPTLADRQLPSPYNTYLNPGLPPQPIANPGLASIKAVLFPQASPFWFYLHDRSGNIHYAKTIEEHQRNINTYIYGQ